MNSFGNRRDCHFSSLNSGRGVNNILQNAWNKYGQNNFEFIILHECVSEEDKTRIDESKKQTFKKTQSLKPNSAKYDIEIVRLIRKMYEQDKKRITEISDDLGINRHTVYLIATYRRWKNAI